ncbi:MAG: ATP-binding cassette domain-containing protein [Acidimicrobiales bacterium]|jgi:ABC-type glutathione transport system ATPase component
MTDDSVWARPVEPHTGRQRVVEQEPEPTPEAAQWAPAKPRVKIESLLTTDHPPSESVLSASGVTRTFMRGSEEIKALKGIDLDLRRGELVALVGRSGSGKTTMLNVLCGWEVPDSGTVCWNGNAEMDVAKVNWAGMALVPQSPGLLDDMTVSENVGLACRLRGDREDVTRVRVDDLLESLGLLQLAGRLPTELSLGEQQRTSVARALVLQPDVLLADEPTAHQDPGFMQKVIDAIRSVVDSNRACLVASHNSEILKAADRVIEMSDGRLISH